jgi:Ni/Fe-hydrogenase subunit HybB-like protein
VPRWTEVAITGGIIAAGFVLFSLAVKYLPIFPAEEAVLLEEEVVEVAVAGEVVGEAVPENAGD